MKKFKIFTVAALAVAALVSCSKENPVETNIVTEPVVVPVTPASTKAITEYYSNWAEFVKKLISSTSLREVAEKFNLPELGKLSELDILDGQGRPIKFDSLSETEQEAFIECAAVELAALQCAKAVQISSLYKEYGFLNDLIVAVSKFAGELLKAGTPIDVVKSRIETMIEEPMVLDICSPFPAVEEAPETKSLIALKDVYTMTYPEFISKMAGVAKKGDLAIIVPISDNPATLVNLMPYIHDNPAGNHHAFGHCAIVMDDFKPTTKEEETLLYGAVEEGVEFESSSTWLTDFYLLEPVKLQFIWNPQNTENPLQIKPKQLPRPERDKFVEFAKKFEHTPFINQLSLEWFTAKKVVPERFTCASLVWYSCQNVFGFDVSLPFIQTVAPVNIVCSSHTVIKKFIGPDEN